MKTVFRVAAFMLLCALTVNGQSNPPGVSTTTAPCVIDTVAGTAASYQWNGTNNTNQFGGSATADTTLDACKASCIANSSCTWLDWDAANPATKCYLGYSWGTTTPRWGLSPGVWHYALTRTGGTSGSSTTCSSADCTIKWSSGTPNTNVNGGTPNPAGYASLVACKAQCEAVSTCPGIDWDPNNPQNQTCWQAPVGGTPRTGLASGVTHYDITSRPGAECSQGCIWLSSTGLAIGHSESETDAFATSDISEATVFNEEPCLARNLARENLTALTDPCISLQVAGKPGYYLRNYNGRLRVNSVPDYVSPDRFYEDASFLKLNRTNATYAFHPVNYRDQYLEVNRGTLQIGGLWSQTWYCSQTATTDTAIITDSCPTIWSRINDASPLPYTESATAAKCRDQGVFYPRLVGVSETNSTGNASCSFVTDGEIGSRLQSRTGYTYYELMKSSPGVCQRGCSYNWVLASTAVEARLPTYTDPNAVSCARRCVQDWSGWCVAIGFNGTTCTLYAAGTSNLVVWAVKPVLTDCGPCEPSVGYAYDWTDDAAVFALTGATDDECLTICLNRRTCYGYERRNGSCYISNSTNNMTLTNRGSGYLFIPVYRSPCGNGCVHSWVFYQNSKMVNSTASPYYLDSSTTEAACRAACIANDMCTSIDWTGTACYLGWNDPEITYGNVAGVSHFDLERYADCSDY